MKAVVLLILLVSHHATCHDFLRGPFKWTGPRSNDQESIRAYRDHLMDEVFLTVFETKKPPGGETFQPMYSPKRKSATLTSRLFRVEVAVVVEDDVVAKYGENLDSFVQATFGEVDRIFARPELGVALEVHVTKLVKLDDFWSGKLRGSSMEEVRKKFCFWQRNFFTDRKHVDVAVYIRSSPTQAPRDEQDYSEPGTMCSHEKSCAVVDDTGLQTYRSIVQQIAFLMNVPFDGATHEMRRIRTYMEKLKKKSEEIVTAMAETGQFQPTSVLDDLGLKLLLFGANVMLFQGAEASTDAFFVNFSQFKSRFLEAAEFLLIRDFPGNNCDRTESGDVVMNPIRKSGVHMLSWSRCSQNSIKEFLLAEERGACLLNEPISVFDTPGRMPGEIFDTSAQCRYQFGADFVAANFTFPYKFCSRLVCTTSEETSHTVSQYPPSSGTFCVPGRSCIDGRCRLPPQNNRAAGHWGSWTSWSTLPHSKTCGLMVEESERKCLLGRRTESNYCFGEKTRFRVVRRTQYCRPYETERICRAFFFRPFSSSWLIGTRAQVERDYEQIDTADVCRLNCRSNLLGRSFSVQQFVEDGSRCGPDSDDVCIRGRCVRLGCNDTLGGAEAFQPCGGCLRSGEVCTKVENRFGSTVTTSEDLLTYPTGSASINITMEGRSKINGEGVRRSDRRYILVLKNAESQELVFDPYHAEPRWFRIADTGSYVHYSGANSTTKRLFISKKLEFPLQLEIRGNDADSIDPYEAIVTSSHYVITESSNIS